MKKIFLTLFVALFGFVAQAQEENTSGAKISFDRKVMEYGKVEKGGNGTRVFKFKNEGTEPLVLNSVRASCGCTTPKWTREPIAPGASGEIEVKFNSKGKKNNQTKTVTINANTDPGQTILKIKAFVNPAETK